MTIVYIYFRAAGFYNDLFAELESLEREIERIAVKTKMQSIIQNQKYYPSVRSGHVGISFS